jgi:hypothetical protein
MYSGQDERAEFSERLIVALTGIGWTKLSPTRLREQFSRRAGTRAVSVHGARKWLIGGSIPTQERLAILAERLQVQPDWLRFGPSKPAQHGRLVPMSDLSMLRDLALLNPANRKSCTRCCRCYCRRLVCKTRNIEHTSSDCSFTGDFGGK